MTELGSTSRSPSDERSVLWALNETQAHPSPIPPPLLSSDP
jgi:hypothetical protein